MPFPTPPSNYNVMDAGGFESQPAETMLDHYGMMRQGPDTEDAVMLNRSIDREVRPDKCNLRKLPKGRIFSLTENDTMVPGVLDEHEIPVACMLIGSNSDDGDVVGGPRIGDPEYYMDAQVPIKDEANAPFWSMGAGYIYETSEFDGAELVKLVPTAPVTSTHDMTDFDIAGMIVPGEVYVDHIIGTVVERPAPCGINSSIQTIRILGGVVPRIRKDVVAKLRP